MARARWGGTLSPYFKYEFLIPMLDKEYEPDPRLNWELLAVKLMPHLSKRDIKKLRVYASVNRMSAVDLMLQHYEEYKGEIDGYELYQALCDIGRHDIAKYMEDNYANVFVDSNQPTDYEKFCRGNVSKHIPYKRSESSAYQLPNCKRPRSTDASGMDLELPSGRTASPEMMYFDQPLGATEATQLEFEQFRGATAATQMDFEPPLRATQNDPQEVSFYTEQGLETDSESVFGDYLPVPLRGALKQLGFRKSGKRRDYCQNSTAESASSRSSDDTMNGSIVVDENASQFENFNGVVRRIQPGEGSMEVEARSRNGQPSVLGSDIDWQGKISAVVGISFTELDRSLAERLAYHLKCYGCRGVLIGKEQVSKLHQLDAIIVVYSFHYKEEVGRPSTFWRKNHIRSVFDFLMKEFSRNGRNQRCILYPTFQLAGQRIPSMFHDHCPRKHKAMQVYRVLFRRQSRC